MPRRPVSRFALEVIFLVAVAAALTVAKERAVVVGGVMFGCWIVVVLFEWAWAYVTYQRSARVIITERRAPRFPAGEG